MTHDTVRDVAIAIASHFPAEPSSIGEVKDALALSKEMACAAIAAMPATQAQGAWQPIETSPKDGSWMLVLGGHPDQWSPAGYDQTTYPPCVVAKWEHDEHCEDLDGWIYAAYDGGHYGEWSDPTHWMPLQLPTRPQTPQETAP